MRNILYIMLVALLCGCNNTSTTEDEQQSVGNYPKRHGYGEWPFDVLYGEVDSICQVQYKLTDRFGTIEEEIDGYTLITFNEDGNVLENITYNSDVNVVSRSVYNYSSVGFPLTMTICDSDNVVIFQERYTTDNSGNITSAASYGHDGMLVGKDVMKYDNNQLIEVKEYDKTGDLTNVVTIKRDKNIASFTYHDNEDNTTNRGTICFNDSGIVTSMKEAKEHGGGHELKSKCNKDGNVTTYTLITDNEVYMEVVRDKFDNHNNAVSWTVFEKDIRTPSMRIEQVIYYHGESNGNKINPIEEASRIQELVKEGLGRNGVYEVGDYYNRDGKQGVVFEVSDGGHHGKIVSLDETYLGWCTYNQYYKNVTVGASNAINGKSNTDLVMARSDSDQYPAFVWCRDKGEDWYLPAHGELQLLGENLTAVNRTLAKYGTKISNSYWSSTEYLVDEGHSAWLVYPSSESIYDRKKYNYINVRAVTTF